MTEHRQPAVIVALKEKAADVRAIAARLNLTFSESVVPGDDEVAKFTFDIPDQDLIRLVNAIPTDVYAHRAVIGERRE